MKNPSRAKIAARPALRKNRSKRRNGPHRNVRVGHCEIDIIARDGDELVFAEVRARRANPIAAPEDTVGPVKLERLTRAAELWTQKANYMGFWRIDLVAVTLYDDGEMNIELVKSITEPIL